MSNQIKIFGRRNSPDIARRATFAMPRSQAHGIYTQTRAPERLMLMIEVLDLGLPPKVCETPETYSFIVRWGFLVTDEPKSRVQQNRVKDADLVRRSEHGLLA